MVITRGLFVALFTLVERYRLTPKDVRPGFDQDWMVAQCRISLAHPPYEWDTNGFNFWLHQRCGKLGNHLFS